MTDAAAAIRIIQRRVGLIFLLVSGAFCCGGAVEGAQASGGANRVTAGGAGGQGGATSTSTLPTYVVLTPEQRDSVMNSGCSNTVAAERITLPLSVSFVVDTSASMLDASGTSSGTIRWSLAHDAVFLALDSLRAGDAAGLVLFPNRTTSSNVSGGPLGPEACVSGAAVQAVADIGAAASDPRVAMRSAINGVVPSGATPVFDSYRVATDFLLKTNKQHYVVLITDGRATMVAGCQGSGTEDSVVETQSIIDAIAENHARGIDTIVAGTTRNEPAVVPSNEERDWLSNAATAGGAAIPSSCSPSGNPKYCHVDLTQGTTGIADLLSAVGQRPACEVSLDSSSTPIPSPDRLYLLFDTPVGSSIIYMVTSADCPNGEGYYLEPATNSATLCPASCRMVQSDPFGALMLFWACDAQRM